MPSPESRIPELSSGHPDELQAAGARECEPKVRHERDVAAGTELCARGAHAAFTDFHRGHCQRASRLWIGNGARPGLGGCECRFVVQVMLKFEQAVEGIDVVHEAGW